MKRFTGLSVVVITLFAFTAPLSALDEETIQQLLQQEIIGPHAALAEAQAFTENLVPLMPKVETLEVWEKQAQQIRQRVLDRVVYRGEAAKWRDEKTKVVWLETIEGGEGYRIKKLRYEAVPGLWVPALLYEPTKLDGKVPVVMNVNGHDRTNGKAAKYKQIRCINQAKRGMIALNVEWLGMGQLNTADFSHYRMNQLDLCGTSGLAPFYLAMKRGLDVLLAHKNADPKRVAVAGLSGGGWQTIVISSLDTRVTLSNPVAGYSSFRTRARHLKDLGDSEQTPSDLATEADYTHLTALLAPRAALLTFNKQDDCCFESGYALPPLLDAARPIYKLYGKENSLHSHENVDPGTHNFEKDNRQALYRAFGRHFFAGQKFDATEIDCEAELKSKEQLDVPLPDNNASFHSLAVALSKSLPRTAPLPKTKDAASKWQQTSRAKLRDVVKWNDYKCVAQKHGSTEKDGVTVTHWRLRIGDHWTVPAVEFAPKAAKGTTIVVDDGGRTATAKAVQQLLADKRRVLAVDPFYFGESKIEKRDFLFGLMVATVGQRPLGVQASQLVAIANWSKAEHKGEAINLHANGPRSSTFSLAAAAVDSKAIDAVQLTGAMGSLKQVIQDNRGVNETPELFCFGLLEQFDVLQMASLVAPRPLKFKNPSAAVGRELKPLKDFYVALGSKHDPLSQLAKTNQPKAKATPGAAAVGALKWRTIGPSSMGGRIVDLEVVPSDPSTWYVAAASGGVFKTTNGGVKFLPIFDSAGGTLSIGDICLAPSNPNIVWVGTGEHNARNSVSWGDGVYKSTDGGKSWQHMGLKKSFQIGRIAIHPTNPDIVLVGAAGRLWGPNKERGLYQTTDGGKTWNKVLHVDDNTGCIDVRFCPGNGKVLLAAMYQRRRDPYDGGDPVVRWGSGSGLYRSTDGGKTWNRLTQGLPTAKMGRIGIAWSKKNPQTVFSIIETEKIGSALAGAKIRRLAYMGISGAETKGGAKLGEVIRGGPSDKAGLKQDDVIVALDDKPIKSYRDLVTHIQKRSAGEKAKVKIRRGEETKEIELTFGQRPMRGGMLGRPFGAILGGQRENMQDKQGKDSFQTGGVFKSTDGGVSWQRVNSLNPRPFYYSQIHVDPTNDNNLYVLGIAIHMSTDGGKTFRTTGRGVHPDHHTMWIDPRDGRHIVLGCDGGLFVTHDRTVGWEFVNNLPIGQFYHITVDNRRMYNVYGGLQDNGSWGGPSATRGFTGPTDDDWFPIFGGDGFICRVDSENPDLIYYEMQYGRMGRVDMKTGQRSSIVPPKIKGKSYRFNWKTPFLLSNHNGRIFYAAGNYVFRSLDGGKNVRIISPEITRTKQGTATALAESPLNPDVLFVGTDDGLLWVTQNGGHDWQNITASIKDLTGPRRISSIEVSRYRAGRVYVTFDGHYYDDDAPHVYSSDDNGKTWHNLRANLPNGTTRVVHEDVTNPNLLYLGTEFGVWASLDRGGSWVSLNNNMPPVAIHELAQHKAAGELIAGTHGRGIWILDVAPLRQWSDKIAKAKAHLFQPKQAVLWSGFTPKRIWGHKYFAGENPTRGAVIYYRLAEQAKNVKLVISSADGKPLRQLKADNKPGMHRVVWDLRRPRGNFRFGSASTVGKYRVLLTVDDKEYMADLLVQTDPLYPQAPTLLELEEQEYQWKVRKTTELTD